MQVDFDENDGVRSKIEANFSDFRELLARAEHHMAQDQDELAILYCEAAAAYAIANHCGIFSSPDLERLIGNLGRKISNRTYCGRRTRPSKSPGHVLHVCSHVMAIGGSSRLVWRWICEDQGRSHSVVLTRQPKSPIPDALVDAVDRCGGKIHSLDRQSGGFLERMKRLSEIGGSADLVVLHTERDVLPLLAFADRECAPPMLFVDHGDHKFRLGLGSSAAVASLRESGMRLAQKRKDLCASRNVLLPTLIEPVTRESTREAAKQSLGLPADCVMLLCVARRVKFKSVGDQSYADLHQTILKKDPRVVFVVLGAGDRIDCSVRSDLVEDRMIFMRERVDTSTFYEAADIYVDSFPFVSITSLLEAGCRGLPLVSYFPHGEAAEIFGSDMPGLTGHLLRAVDLDEYNAMISGLLSNEDDRRDLGERTRLSIETRHAGAHWLAALQQAYEAAFNGHGKPLTTRQEDEPSFGEVDRLVPFVCAQGQSKNHAIQEQLKIYRPAQRFRYWLKLGRENGVYDFIRGGALRCFLPDGVIHALRNGRRFYRERQLHRRQTRAVRLVS